MEQQNYADTMKGIVLDAGTTREQQLALLRVISLFERCSWHAGMFADACTATDGVYLHGDQLQINSLEAIQDLISNYVELAGTDPEVMGMEDAADYLGISRDMLYTYVTRQKRLRGTMIGRSMVFTRQQLDAFNAQRRTYTKS